MKNFYAQKDLNSIKNLTEKYKFQKIYITGDIETGKSHFCEKLTKQITDYKFIKLDKERDKDTSKSRNETLKEVIKENKNNSYILEHYQLLNDHTLAVWEKEADILILLNPKRENFQNGFDYDTGPIQKNNFDRLKGEIIYCNPITGTYVKYMNRRIE